MKKAFRVGLTAAVAVAALTLPASAAHANGDLCNVSVNTWVERSPGGAYMYTIPAGGGFRLEGYTNGYWEGHGNGQETGWIRDDGRLYGC